MLGLDLFQYSLKKVCSDWRDIALTIHDTVFAEDEEELIDVLDVKVSCFVIQGFYQSWV